MIRVPRSPGIAEYTVNVTSDPVVTVALSAGDTGCGGGTGVITNDPTGPTTSQLGVAAQSMWDTCQ
jgi:hypothetical protein